MSRFERVLASCPDQPPSMAELCAATGVPERTLRMHCATFLDMSPLAYVRLRRLNLARRAFLRTDSRAATVAGIARRYGFSELGALRCGVPRDLRRSTFGYVARCGIDSRACHRGADGSLTSTQPSQFPARDTFW